MVIGVEVLEQICDTRRAGSQSAAQVEIQVYNERAKLPISYLAHQGRQHSNWIFFRLMQTGLSGEAPRLFEKAPADHPFRHVKFHITLPEVNKMNPGSDFARGLKLISSVLINRQIASFKVLVPTLSFEKYSFQQRGKVITIFGSGNPELTRQDWIRLLAEIDITLRKAQVAPGLRPETDPSYERAETGLLSPYTSYRVTEGDDPMSLQAVTDAQSSSGFTL